MYHVSLVVFMYYCWCVLALETIYKPISKMYYWIA